MIDNSEWEEVLNKLENLEDQELASNLLAQVNQKSKAFGQLLMNKDQSLSHADWKAKCDEAKLELDNLLKTIDQL